MMAFHIIALILSCVLVIFLVYRGLNLPCAILIGSFCIILTNGLDLMETVTAMMNEVGSMAQRMMLPYLLGAILAKILMDTGCTQKLAHGLLDLFAKGKSAKVRYCVAVTIAIVVNAALGYCNLQNPLIQGAIVVGMCLAADMPRKYLPVLCTLGATVGTVLPGSVLMNLFCSMFLTGSAFDGWPVLIILSLFIAIPGIWSIVRSVGKDTANGEHFDYGPLAPVQEIEENAGLPWWCGLIPFAAILVPYILFKAEAWLSILIGILVSLVLYYKELPRKNERGETLGKVGVVGNVLNTGYILAGMPCLMLFNNALAAAISGTDAFGAIAGWFANLPFAPLVNLGILGTLLTGLSSGPAGFLLGLQEAVSVYIPAGVSAAACRAVMISTYVVLDTLPTHMGLIILVNWAGVTVKEAYPIVLKTTVIITGLGMVLTVLLCTLFPGLAATVI